jgi:hypothetical protein
MLLGRRCGRTKLQQDLLAVVRLREPDAIAVYKFAREITTKVWVVDQWPEHGGCTSPGDWLDFILDNIHKMKSRVW